ncbi:MAG: FlgB family protein [Rhodobacteraceae bacterium]|nr:FlgB family protein [Paracoccaceae bacterium]
MFGKLEIFRMAQGLATHAAARQSAIAQNVANADTPGYRARDLAPFSQTYQTQGGDSMRTTRAGHVLAGESSPASLRVGEAHRAGAISPNGNNVSLETEMMMAAEVQRDHELALTVYRSSLSILRSSLGRR